MLGSVVQYITFGSTIYYFSYKLFNTDNVMIIIEHVMNSKGSFNYCQIHNL